MTNLLDKAMRKIEKAFNEYETAVENMDDTSVVPSDYDPEKFFFEQVRQIVGLAVLDGAKSALDVTMKDLKESLSDLKSDREAFVDGR